jgi:hypothetical protein
MSLQLIAKQMEAKGRNGDSVLVHMTPGEVEGLQKLAESAGGSLSVNPETGLVEANFLKKLISSPMFAPLAGAGLMMVPGVGPMMAAGLVGGGTALATGDIGKGAMAGLGAYGGAGLAGGLSGLGSTALTPEAIATANASADPIASLVTAKDAATSAGVVPATGFKAIASGAQQAMANPSALVNQMGGVGGLAKAAGMAAAPMLTQEQKMAEAPVDDEMYVYDFDYGRTGADRMPTDSSAERTYFQPTYSNRRKIKAEDYLNAAEGGLMSLAEGGSTAAPSQGMTGGSAAAFDYLMGAAPSSAGLSSMAMQAPATQAPMADSGKMYTFNPATGAFARNPNFVDPAVAAQAAKDAAAAELERQMNRGGGGTDVRGGFDSSSGNVGGSGGRGRDGTATGGMGPSSARAEGGEIYADGGLMGLAKGGMKSGGFVVPADVVSMIGEGNTDAGYNRIKSMIPDATAIKGKDGGQADTVKTSIEGKQPARVAHGEMYIPPETVKRMGGAKKLYAMMDRVRQQATGSKKQIKPVNLRRAMA